MRRQSIIAPVALFAKVLVASPAFAATRHSVKVALKETAIYVTPGPGPGPPSFAREAGLFTGSLGNGVNRTDVHVLAGKGTREFFTRQGSIHGSLVFTGAPKPGGDTIIGTLTITGGTGKYAHAHGKLHINGFHSSQTNYSTEHISGTLTY
jgi:hypothetical protein